MPVLSIVLHYYIHLILNMTLDGNLKAMFSDANVPGEGEHKIMFYIRLQRNLPGFDPNTRHCLYGLQYECFLCGQMGHMAAECEGKAKRKAGEFDEKGKVVPKMPYQFLHIWSLREYLEYEMRIPNVPFEIDLECFVDDFIFMCFFVGNDFLPHIPTLEIREGAINLLLAVYKKEFRAFGGYLTDGSKPNLSRVELYIQAVGAYEDKIFSKRARLHQVMGEPGWKERYYEEKFSTNSLEELDRIHKDVVSSYTEGLCWVMHYYYEGVCSWQWFYPYHHAPFASDLKDLGQLNINFELGSPIKPSNQLLGVFPAASSHALPQQYRKLMTDSNSPIIDFYPAGRFLRHINHKICFICFKLLSFMKLITAVHITNFEVDINGKRFAWKGIAKLPFIDEARLLAEVAKIEATLTDEEVWRNSRMYDMLFVSVPHPLCPYIFSLDDRCRQLDDKERNQIKEQLDLRASGAMNGYISLCFGDPSPPIFRSLVEGKEDITGNQVICARYRLPDAHNHIAHPPPGDCQAWGSDARAYSVA